ncbi:hypothetical protein J6590_040480 [Homalodisca vitripennis]|nr:hypothetical protein J6590_040480 [Homalodisca vitripennis]
MIYPASPRGICEDLINQNKQSIRYRIRTTVLLKVKRHREDFILRYLQLRLKYDALDHSTTGPPISSTFSVLAILNVNSTVLLPNHFALPAMRSRQEIAPSSTLTHPAYHVKKVKVRESLITPGEVRGKKPSLTLNLGTNGLKVTSEPPPTAEQAGCLQGQDLSGTTHPSSHARRCLTRLCSDKLFSHYRGRANKT